jgi:hypothetical protein
VSDPVDKALDNFLKDESLKVAVIKGQWGVGKTYFWRKFFETHKATLPFKAYSYVSLFGAARIADLQKQIFANFVMLDETTLSRHLEKLKPLSTLLKSVDIPYLKSTSALADVIENQLVENFLICFDDLERKEGTISASSVLGLITRLKEEKNCKILLIYNDQQFDDATKNEINEYREKVVDLELSYTPTIQNNLEIIWPGGCPKHVAAIFETLGLNNVRIMQRVRWAEEYFREYIEIQYPHLKEPFERKTAMLTVLYHEYSKQFSLGNR